MSVKVNTKMICDECNWRGTAGELLSATNPFDTSDTFCGCPQCKQINVISEACDEPNCWKYSSCGTPTAEGYRRTCYEHMPK